MPNRAAEFSWSEPESDVSNPAGLSRGRIVEVAIELADADGLEALERCEATTPTEAE